VAKPKKTKLSGVIVDNRSEERCTCSYAMHKEDRVLRLLALHLRAPRYGFSNPIRETPGLEALESPRAEDYGAECVDGVNDLASPAARCQQL
jgi:hypothetical protein